MKKKKLKNNFPKLICVVSLVISSFIIGYFLLSKKNIQNVFDSIVQVESEFGWGSGVLIAKDKYGISSSNNKYTYYILTAYHLINNHVPREAIEEYSRTAEFTLWFYGREEEIKDIEVGKFLYKNDDLDLMVITFSSDRDFPLVKISTNYNVLDEVCSFTCQVSEPPAATYGIISRLKEEYIVSDAQISPGSSGGGLFIKCRNEFRLIGIANSIFVKNGIPFFHISNYISSKFFVKFLEENHIPCTIL